jgi:hypothetical protein
MRRVAIFVIITMLLSGCLSIGDKTEQNKPYIPQIVEQKWENHSYQFWNLAPMSMGNQTTVSFNQTGNVTVTVELDVWFHESLLWEQGFMNYTLINENESVFSHELSEGDGYFEISIVNVSNLTIQIRASGSENITDEKPGDWFMARTYCEMKK